MCHSLNISCIKCSQSTVHQNLGPGEEEGLEETLTVHRLHIPAQLRKTLACTNIIESAFSIVEKVCSNVKRWHGGDQRERWVGSGLLIAEQQFRRVQGYKQIPTLIRELETSAPAKPNVVKRRKAS
jgi:putative transposase